MASDDSLLLDLVRRVRIFEREAHEILGVHEAAPSRLYSLDHSYSKLGALTLSKTNSCAKHCDVSSPSSFAQPTSWLGPLSWTS